MTHEELRQKAIEFLSNAFAGTEDRTVQLVQPAHLIQAAVTIVLSCEPPRGPMKEADQ